MHHYYILLILFDPFKRLLGYAVNVIERRAMMVRPMIVRDSVAKLGFVVSRSFRRINDPVLVAMI